MLTITALSQQSFANQKHCLESTNSEEKIMFELKISENSKFGTVHYKSGSAPISIKLLSDYEKLILNLSP